MTSRRNNKLDERQLRILSNSLALSAIFIYLYEIVVILIKYNKTGSFSSALVELILVVCMIFGMIVFYLASNQYDSSIEKRSNRKNPISKIDERQKSLIINSLAFASFIAYFGNLIIILIKILDRQSFSSALSEIILLSFVGLIIIFYRMWNREYDVPTTFFGYILPTGDSKKEKEYRIKNYISNAIKLGVIFTILDSTLESNISILQIIESKILVNLFNFLLRFVVFFVINFLWGEFNIRRENKYMKTLIDEDEN